MNTYDRIAECAAVYASARNRATINDGLTAQDDVLRARLALAQCILEAGWVPPPQVHAELALDRTTAEHRVGAAEAQAEAQAEALRQAD